MVERMIQVEVVYADAERQILRQASVAQGSTVMQAIHASGIAQAVPALEIDPGRLGIFARKAAPEQVLRDGDRVEIYRPLTLDPMESRRRRAR